MVVVSFFSLLISQSYRYSCYNDVTLMLTKLYYSTQLCLASTYLTDVTICLRYVPLLDFISLLLDCFYSRGCA